jgi:hypothetical protein
VAPHRQSVPCCKRLFNLDRQTYYCHYVERKMTTEDKLSVFPKLSKEKQNNVQWLEDMTSYLQMQKFTKWIDETTALNQRNLINADEDLSILQKATLLEVEDSVIGLLRLKLEKDVLDMIPRNPAIKTPAELWKWIMNYIQEVSPEITNYWQVKLDTMRVQGIRTSDIPNVLQSLKEIEAGLTANHAFNESNMVNIVLQSFPKELKSEAAVLQISVPYPTMDVVRNKLAVYHSRYLTNKLMSDLDKVRMEAHAAMQKEEQLSMSSSFASKRKVLHTEKSAGPHTESRSPKRRYESIENIKSRDELLAYPSLVKKLSYHAKAGHACGIRDSGRVCWFDAECKDPPTAVKIFKEL